MSRLDHPTLLLVLFITEYLLQLSPIHDTPFVFSLPLTSPYPPPPRTTLKFILLPDRRDASTGGSTLNDLHSKVRPSGRSLLRTPPLYLLRSRRPCLVRYPSRPPLLHSSTHQCSGPRTPGRRSGNRRWDFLSPTEGVVLFRPCTPTPPR